MGKTKINNKIGYFFASLALNIVLKQLIKSQCNVKNQNYYKENLNTRIMLTGNIFIRTFGVVKTTIRSILDLFTEYPPNFDIFGLFQVELVLLSGVNLTAV